MVEACWEIGRQIVEAMGERAEYGKYLLRYLSERLMAEYGKGFTERSLRQMRSFYLAFPIRRTLCAELSWSIYRRLARIPNKEQREFYRHAAAEERWTVRQLDHQIATCLSSSRRARSMPRTWGRWTSTSDCSTRIMWQGQPRARCSRARAEARPGPPWREGRWRCCRTGARSRARRRRAPGRSRPPRDPRRR